MLPHTRGFRVTAARRKITTSAFRQFNSAHSSTELNGQLFYPFLDLSLARSKFSIYILVLFYSSAYLKSPAYIAYRSREY